MECDRIRVSSITCMHGAFSIEFAVEDFYVPSFETPHVVPMMLGRDDLKDFIYFIGSIDAQFCGVYVDDETLHLEFSELGTGEIYQFDFNDIRSFEGALREYTDLLDGLDDPETPDESLGQVLNVLFGDIEQRREVFFRVANDLIQSIPHQFHGSFTCRDRTLFECHGH